MAEAALARAACDRRLRFVCPGVKFEIGRNASVELGRWSWLGHGCKVRAHEGTVSIGAKSVLGQECTISAYQHVSIGRECIIADRVMIIDFDHGVVEVERPIREQGIYKRDVNIGHNVWIGYGACLLRGITVGDNAVIGTSAVVTADVAANAVVGGIPARLIRMRAAPGPSAGLSFGSVRFAARAYGLRAGWQVRVRRVRRANRIKSAAHGEACRAVHRMRAVHGTPRVSRRI